MGGGITQTVSIYKTQTVTICKTNKVIGDPQEVYRVRKTSVEESSHLNLAEHTTPFSIQKTGGQIGLPPIIHYEYNIALHLAQFTCYWIARHGNN